MVNGRIQAFPAVHWREEFATAAGLSLYGIEWTIDQESIDANPLMTAAGQAEIQALMGAHQVRVPSLTGDCFMQEPFWKAAGDARDALLILMRRLLEASAAVGIEHVVIPLVDNGRLEDATQEAAFVETMTQLAATLRALRVTVVVESDFAPQRLAKFIARLPADCCGINYDIGNSASLGFDPAEEIAAYAERIMNVHVKDRLRGGTTVPLGTGAADLAGTIRLLERVGYRGRYVLQTARAADGDHAGAIRRYRDMLAGWMRDAHAA
jgi:L-ribulose-5-phosphate 3-epimerase